MQRITATYRIESSLPADQAADTLAGEQSCGTFVLLPGETADLHERAAARVETVRELGESSVASLRGSRPGTGPFRQAEVEISWPYENVGSNLPALMSTIAGNLYELSQVSGIKLLDFNVPPAFAANFRGPAYGVDGTRETLGIASGPMIGTIIKPSVGLSPIETAELVVQLLDGGIDFIKDDELMANPPHSPFGQRVEAVMQRVNEHRQLTGRQVMVAFNITDDLQAMNRHYDTILQYSGTCAMLSLNSVGLTATKAIADRGELVIHGHRNGWGMLTRHPLLGIEFRAYQKLWRLAGVDHLHVNGIQNKFWESDDSVVQSIKSCSERFANCAAAVPVVSSGQWGGQAFETYRRTQTDDLLYLAGGGIFAHPMGPASGVRALRQAWRAAKEGQTLREAANRHEEFRASVAKFAPQELTSN